MKLQKQILTGLAAAMLGLGLAHAAPVVIDFEADTTGAKPNGFTPMGHPGVSFTDTMGAGLQIFNTLPTECAAAGNKCLLAFADDTSAVQIDFAFLVDSLSMDFGNDQAGFIPAGGLAYLQVFLNNIMVGEASTVVNLDDIMNQSVGIANVVFDRAIFAYTDANKNRVNLIEVIDNVTYTVANRVPEPGTLALAGLALAGLGALRRGKKA